MASDRQPLETYRAKRRFDRTPEPAGGQVDAEASGRFVVQRHRARRLHYDFRLELNGVLVSWAVPKGPTLDPATRRLAVHVEDHPVEYLDFEGVIPGGEYGGGDVIVWDRGMWAPEPGTDPVRGLQRGELHVDLFGDKLEGRFVLIHTDQSDQWLLLHKHDEHAVPGWDPEDHPLSVKSGRTNDEVAAAPTALWRSDLPADRAELTLAATDDELAALDALGTKGRWHVAGRDLEVTNLDKVLFPASGSEPEHTKRDLIRYYTRLAPVLLPYLTSRPVNFHRYPNGVEQKGFWQKAIPDYAPDWISRWHNDEADAGETEWYAVLDSAAAIAWAANNGAVEVHPWTSRIADVHRPTWAFIDIDPGTSTSFDDVVLLARLYRTALDHLGVVGLPKVTGRRGIQIWVPIQTGPTFEATRRWVEAISRAVGATVPELVSWVWEKNERGGLARLDYTQNAINRTLVAPYSVRAAAGAPVSVPLEWDELDDPELRPDRWTITTVLERLDQVGDPFARLLTVRQDLPKL
jgi:bifunctional non-homologous end joining protein LigD